jgi:hypothetical protein
VRRPGTQTFCLCAERICNPLSFSGGQHARWPHRLKAYVPFSSSAPQRRNTDILSVRPTDLQSVVLISAANMAASRTG